MMKQVYRYPGGNMFSAILSSHDMDFAQSRISLGTDQWPSSYHLSGSCGQILLRSTLLTMRCSRVFGSDVFVLLDVFCSKENGGRHRTVMFSLVNYRGGGLEFVL